MVEICSPHQKHAGPLDQKLAILQESFTMYCSELVESDKHGFGRRQQGPLERIRRREDNSGDAGGSYGGDRLRDFQP